VVVLTPDGALSAGRPFEPDEPARHKLLDLVGDLYLYGGPPVGHVRAVRPGHAANALAMRRARDEGIVVSD
jgi:UDP-3-O-acyl-N-acetylglucosamine deacetylase